MFTYKIRILLVLSEIKFHLLSCLEPQIQEKIQKYRICVPLNNVKILSTTYTTKYNRMSLSPTFAAFFDHCFNQLYYELNLGIQIGFSMTVNHKTSLRWDPNEEAQLIHYFPVTCTRLFLTEFCINAKFCARLSVSTMI